MSRQSWHVALSKNAATDFAQILRWTHHRFGTDQVEIYRLTLQQALQALHDGPEILGVKQRNDIATGILTLHVARDGRKGRHFIVFRIGGERRIDVLRLLHDSMDFIQHLPD